MEILDFILIVSLSLLSVCFLVFLAFFVPILIQIARIFDSINTILVMSKDSVSKLLNKINNASDSAEKFTEDLGSNLKAIFVGIKAGAKNFFSFKK
ncbi:MAG: hypothetical protein MK033_05260 [Candidatus Caenarcaniphilales bacterium]|nr:hypothetical protein [Candidatus Caenarcaniphilales bacterium]